MEEYGPTLREIRLQKGYTLKQLAEGIMSVSFLSKFERGDSDISLFYFSQLLDRLAVSFDEFFHLHHQGEWETFETFFDEAEEAFVHREVERIRRLRKKQLAQWRTKQMDQYLCNALMLEIYESILCDERMSPEHEALQTLYDYLFRVEVWGNYEMRLYNSTMLAMPIDMVLILSKTAYEKGYEYRGMGRSTRILTRILLNTITYLTGGEKEFHYEEEVGQFFQFLETIGLSENDLYTRNFLLQMKGIYEIRKGNVEKGIRMAKKAIHISTELGAHQLAAQMENYLGIVLGRHQS